MEPDVPGLLFDHYSAFLFDFAERCIGPKAENNDSTGRADEHSRKNISFSRKTDWDPKFVPGRKIETGPLSTPKASFRRMR